MLFQIFTNHPKLLNNYHMPFILMMGSLWLGKMAGKFASSLLAPFVLDEVDALALVRKKCKLFVQLASEAIFLR